MILCTLPSCGISLGSLKLAASEAGDFMEFILLYIETVRWVHPTLRLLPVMVAVVIGTQVFFLFFLAQTASTSFSAVYKAL
jgi:hypothetical protein